MTRKLTKIENTNQSYDWGSGNEADSIRTLTSRDLAVSVQQILKGRNLEEGVWVFGYGSLMWNPDFKYVEKITGEIVGLHRSLCLKSTVYRGSSDYHGMVFGLDKGYSCQGIAFRISLEDIWSELQKVWEREMFAETYIPTWVSVRTEIGVVSAITFVINPAHDHYLPNLDLDTIAKRVVRAEGKCGSCLDYVRNTVNYLHQLELSDFFLEQLLTLIESHINSNKNN